MDSVFYHKDKTECLWITLLFAIVCSFTIGIALLAGHLNIQAQTALAVFFILGSFFALIIGMTTSVILIKNKLDDDACSPAACAVAFVLLVLWGTGYITLVALFLIYGENAAPAGVISVDDISEYPQYSRFRFSDGDILQNYTSCGLVDNVYIGVAPIVSSAEHFTNSTVVPAFAVTYNINQSCQVLSSANWDLPIRQGSLLPQNYFTDVVSDYIQTAYQSLNLTTTASWTLITWQYIGGAQHKAFADARIGFATFVSLIATTYFVLVLYYSMPFIKSKLCVKGTHVRYDSIDD